MKQLAIIFTLISMLTLSACGSSPASQNTPTSPAIPTKIGDSASGEPACASIDANPTPLPDENSLFPPVSSEEHMLGDETSGTTFIVYNDFVSPISNYVSVVFSRVLNAYPDEIKLVVRHVPTSDLSFAATQVAEAAGLQGKFWEMHNLLYNGQQDWVGLSVDDFKAWIYPNAASIGLDAEKFQSDFQSDAITKKVQADKDFWSNLTKQVTAEQMQLTPPVILLNGEPQVITMLNINTLPLFLQTTVEMNKLTRRQFTTCPPIVINPAKQYTATLKTAQGDVVISLFVDKAPMTVNNFVYLAQQGWFDNITFHRVLPGFIAQTGDPSGTGMGTPGYFINDEIDPTMGFDRPGLVAMANSGQDTNGSQFFITYAPAPTLTGGYTIFGEVLNGMDVLAKLTPRDPSRGEVLPDGDKLISVTITER